MTINKTFEENKSRGTLSVLTSLSQEIFYKEKQKLPKGKTLSDFHALFQEQIQSLKEACRAKDVMI